MPSPRRNNEGLLARVNFPLYTLQMLTSRHVIVGGGGGSSKTGVANGFEIFELSHDGKRFIVEEMVRHETGSSVVMNCACYSNSKRTFLVAGQESHCQLYNVSFNIVNRRRTTSVSSNDPHQGETKLRRRGSRVRGTSVSEEQTPVTKEKDKEKEKVNRNSNEFRHLEFHIKPVDSVQTDFSKHEPLQKVVRISRAGELMATGGTDGHVRVWRFPSLQPVHNIDAHSKEVDDLDFSPDSKMLVSISKDGQALIWNLETGKKLQSMTWPTPNGTKYVYKRCRFGWKEEDGVHCRLFLISNPVNRVGKQLAYIQLWDPVEAQLKKSAIIEESLSALAVRDDGRFVAVGTMFSGSVYIYIAFSLQQVLCVHDAHGMFVTGLEFLPAISEDSTITTMSEAAVISISVDNRICVHNLPYRRTVEAYKSKWFAFNAMAFLDEKTEPRETVSSQDSEETEKIIDESESAASACTSKAFKTPKGPPLRKRKKDDRMEAFQYLQKAAEADTPQDDCTSFGSYVANKLKKYSEHERAIAQHRISNVFFDIDMARYTKCQTPLIQNLQPQHYSPFPPINSSTSSHQCTDISFQQPSPIQSPNSHLTVLTNLQNPSPSSPIQSPNSHLTVLTNLQNPSPSSQNSDSAQSYYQNFSDSDN